MVYAQRGNLLQSSLFVIQFLLTQHSSFFYTFYDSFSANPILFSVPYELKAPPTPPPIYQ